MTELTDTERETLAGVVDRLLYDADGREVDVETDALALIVEAILTAHLARVEGEVERYRSAFLRANEACSIREATILRVEALADEACENYHDPLNPDAAQDCITAGPEVFAAEACCRCRVRAALAAPTPTEVQP